MTTASHAKKLGVTPIARLAGWGLAGCDPTVMGIGPVPAIRNMLAKTGITLDDVDLIEINEAFAPQVLACAKDLGIDALSDKSKLNVDGGAIAIGHPLGASGARITTHLIHALGARKGTFGVGSACIGGGQGIAVLVERL